MGPDIQWNHHGNQMNYIRKISWNQVKLQKGNTLTQTRTNTILGTPVVSTKHRWHQFPAILSPSPRLKQFVLLHLHGQREILDLLGDLTLASVCALYPSTRSWLLCVRRSCWPKVKCGRKRGCANLHSIRHYRLVSRYGTTKTSPDKWQHFLMCYYIWW